MNLPREILDSIFNHLSRHDLCALSLVSRQWNEITAPSLYKTVIIVLWWGISLAPKCIRSLVLPPHHSKAHLIENVVLLAGYEYEETRAAEWETGSSKTVNELMYAFLSKLRDGQLRRFIWRSQLPFSRRILDQLANHQGHSLECLYLDTIQLREEQLPDQEEDHRVFSKFRALVSLRWRVIGTLEDVQVLLTVLKASASSLRSLSLGYDRFKSRFTAENVRATLEKRGEIKLPALLEYQTAFKGVGPPIFDPIMQPSQLQRVHLTQFVVPSTPVAEFLFSLSRLVEIRILYEISLPRNTEAAIFHHGETLEVLSICASTKHKLTDAFPTRKLLELGRRCPKLSELAISQDLKIYEEMEYRHHPDRNTATPPNSLADFPLHVFRNLKLLFVAVPAENNESLLDNMPLKENYWGQLSVTRALLEMMLNKWQPPPNSSDPPIPSRALELVALFMGNSEYTPPTNVRRAPLLWQTVYSNIPGDKRLALEPTSLEDVLDSGRAGGVIRRYPYLVPNEGLRSVFQRPHLPSASEIS